MALDDLELFDRSLTSQDGALRFVVPRNWALVAAPRQRAAARPLLAHARKIGAAPEPIATAERVLHQPSDAPPHDDHLHVRIRCTAVEREEDFVS